MKKKKTFNNGQPNGGPQGHGLGAADLSLLLWPAWSTHVGWPPSQVWPKLAAHGQGPPRPILAFGNAAKKFLPTLVFENTLIMLSWHMPAYSNHYALSWERMWELEMSGHVLSYHWGVFKGVGIRVWLKVFQGTTL